MPITPLPENTKRFIVSYFDVRPDGQKIKYGTDLSTFSQGPLTHEPYQLKNSLIKLNGKVYQIAKGENACIGKGAFGRVKFAKSILDEREIVVKIETQNEAHQQREEDALIDLSLTQGKVKRPNSEKHYTEMPYLGVNLETFLNQNTLSIDEKFTLSILLCYQVHCLHVGTLSKTHTSYAHRDIKPSNIVIDNFKPQLVDYGLVRLNAFEKNYSISGTPFYMARYDRIFTGGLTNQQHDMLALRRTLYLPNNFVGNEKFYKNIHKTFPNWTMILSEPIVSSYFLEDYLDTGCAPSDTRKDDKGNISYDARQLAAILILAKFNFPRIFFKEAESNKQLSSSILLLFLSHADDASTLKNKISSLLYYLDKQKHLHDIKNLSLLFDANITKDYGRALFHTPFLASLENTSCTLTRRALGCLYKLNLTHPDDLQEVVSCKPFAITVISLYQDSAFEIIQNIFSSTHYKRALQNLIKQNQDNNFQFICQHAPIALKYIEKSNTPSLTMAIIELAKLKVSSHQFFDGLVYQNKKDSFYFIPNKVSVSAILFLKKTQNKSLYFWALKDRNSELLNTLEKFYFSAICPQKLKEEFNHILLKISLYPEYRSAFENCRANKLKQLITLKFISINGSAFTKLNDITNSDAETSRFYPLFESSEFSDLAIFYVLSDPQYEAAFFVCREHALTYKDTNTILTNPLLVNKITDMPKTEINYLFLYNLCHPLTFDNARFFKARTEKTHNENHKKKHSDIAEKNKGPLKIIL